MKRLLLTFIFMLLIGGGFGSTVRATVYATNYTDPVALPALGQDYYLGEMGGLYPGGSNAVPAAYQTNEIDPAIATLGGDSHIVVLCLGMSNLKHSCDELISRLDGAVNPAVTIVNGGQPGRAQQAWDGILSDQVWVNADKRLTQAGESPGAVDVVLYFNAWGYPDESDFTTYITTMRGSLQSTMDNIAAHYANTQLIYLTSREYAGFATSNLNPEPWAYWDGFAVKGLIADRINGVSSTPPLLWQAYQWDASWPASYYVDGVHLSAAGLDAAGDLWLAALLTQPWFAAGPVPTVTPTLVPTVTPTSDPAATATPTAVFTPTPTLTATPANATPTATPVCPPWAPPDCWATPTARATPDGGW